MLDSRKVQEGDKEREQVLIKWVGQSMDDATWLEVEPFQQQFPDFNLGDKVVSKRERIVREKNIEDIEMVESIEGGTRKSLWAGLLFCYLYY